MWPFSFIQRETRYLTTALGTLKKLAHIDPNSEFLVADEMENVVDRFADRTAFLGDGNKWSFANFDAYANKVASWALSIGMKPGETLALFSRNRIEYVAIWYGLSKIGIKAALVNDLLSGKGLAHCLSVAKSKVLLMEPTLAAAGRSAQGFLDTPLPMWTFDGSDKDTGDFDMALKSQSDTRPDRSLRAGIKARDTLLKMFTSGTTGMPKSVRVSHVRAQRYMHSFSAATKAGENDRMMMVLPLYHATGGLCGVGTALMNGGAVIVEPGFSASRFWQTASEKGATLFTYVGELCRFLLNTAPGPADGQHKIRAMLGNGLRPEVWRGFSKRFGVGTIAEFYGSTEGNVGLMNADGQVGAMGRIPWYVKKSFNLHLVQHDFENSMPLRGKDGFCKPVASGETGEAIGRIDPDDPRFLFEGYGSQKETEKKILHDVFESGDRYFCTGDLMRRDKHAYYYFVDRVGDTYRWKAQNVATGEVTAVLAQYTPVQMANVYGIEIPGHDGRAGMAALVLDPQQPFDGAALGKLVSAQLPDYARPLFLRLVAQEETTGTFKLVKTELVKKGIETDPASDPVYILDAPSKSYIPLDAQKERQILSGSARL